LNLISQLEDFLSEQRILLKACGLAFRACRTLYVPVAESEFSDRPKVSRTSSEFPLEDALYDPAETAKRGRRDLFEFRRNESAGDVDRKHLLKELALPPHNVK